MEGLLHTCLLGLGLGCRGRGAGCREGGDRGRGRRCVEQKVPGQPLSTLGGASALFLIWGKPRGGSAMWRDG